MRPVFRQDTYYLGERISNEHEESVANGEQARARYGRSLFVFCPPSINPEPSWFDLAESVKKIVRKYLLPSTP